MSVSFRSVSRTARLLPFTRPSSSQYRSYSDTPYPFTKPANAPPQTPKDKGSSASYPFTKPSDPAPIASPSGVVDRPGPAVDNSAVVSREAEDEGAVDRPGIIAADYRTSYVQLSMSRNPFERLLIALPAPFHQCRCGCKMAASLQTSRLQQYYQEHL